MKSLIKNISSNSEIILLIFLSLGYFISTSTWRWLISHQDNYDFNYNNADAIFLILYEIFVLLCFYWVLTIRGWKKVEFGIEITWILTGAGLLLFLVKYFLANISYAIFLSKSDTFGLYSNIDFSNEIALPLSVVMNVVNSFFEEFILCAYLITALSKRHDIYFVIGISLLVRMLYHTYQGPLIVISILPTGLLFAYVYWKWGKLWPLVLAHIMWNIFATT